MIDETSLRGELAQRILGQVEIETILKKIHRKKLQQTERNYLSRSIRPKLRAAALLTQQGVLAQLEGKRKDLSFTIISSLDYYGYPLLSHQPLKQRRRILLLEELITLILVEQPEARFIEAIPILLVKNTMDPFILLDLAVRHGIKNKIGYLLEMALLLKHKQSLKPLLLYLKKTKDPKLQLLVDGDFDFLLQTTPHRLRQWNLLGRFFDEDFKKLAKVYT